MKLDKSFDKYDSSSTEIISNEFFNKNEFSKTKVDLKNLKKELNIVNPITSNCLRLPAKINTNLKEFIPKILSFSQPKSSKESSKVLNRQLSLTNSKSNTIIVKNNKNLNKRGSLCTYLNSDLIINNLVKEKEKDKDKEKEKEKEKEKDKIKNNEKENDKNLKDNNKAQIKENDSNEKQDKENLRDIIYFKFKSSPIVFTVMTKYMDEDIDNYVHHNLVEINSQFVYIFIFKYNLYITTYFDEKDNKTVLENPIIYKSDYLHIFYKEIFIAEDENTSNHINLQFYENDMKEKYEIRMNLKFKNDSYYIFHFIKKYYILNWQVFYEDFLLQDYKTQHYIIHFQIKKLNSRGKSQDRVIAISNKFIFNVVLESKKEEIKIDEVKWSDSIKAIENIVLSNSNSANLKVLYDEKLNKEENKKEGMKKIKSKSERDFIFLNKKCKEEFVFILRKLYFYLTKKYVKVSIQ